MAAEFTEEALGKLGEWFPNLETVTASWATPTVDDAKNVTRASGQMQSLARDTNLWATPRAEDGERGQGSKFDGLSEDVKACATPPAQDGHNSSLPPSQNTRDTLPGNVGAWSIGAAPLPSEVLTAPSDSSPPKPRSRGLNPRFGLWLMGFPVAWLDSVPSGTRSSLRARTK